MLFESQEVGVAWTINDFIVISHLKEPEGELSEEAMGVFNDGTGNTSEWLVGYRGFDFIHC